MAGTTVVAYYGGYYRGYYPYYGYYGSFYCPWYGFGWWGAYPWYGYGYAGPVYYGYGYDPSDSSVRLEVSPRETEVYVDGSLAGIVDDFDGTFQRLHLPPGDHEIELYLQGYKSVRQQVLLTPGTTLPHQARHAAAGPGEPQDPKPPPSPHRPLHRCRAPPGIGGLTGPCGPPRPAPEWACAPVAGRQSNFGTLSIRVQPPGADVLIDGERWQGPDGQQRLIVEVAEGVHRSRSARTATRTSPRRHGASRRGAPSTSALARQN